MSAAKRMAGWTRAAAAAGLLCIVSTAGAAELNLKKSGDKADASIKLRVEAPPYQAPPGSHLYGAPYPPPHAYYYPYPYPYPYPPPYPPAAAAPAPMEQARYDAGHVIVLVDPVSAEVYFDGVRLKQRDDLSYAVAVLEGRHVLHVAARGYEPYEKPIEVLGGRGMFVTVRLIPAGTPPPAAPKTK